MGIKRSAEFRLSHQALKVLNMFFVDPRRELAGSDILIAARVASGTLYPMLQRFEDAGWLTSKWEIADPAKQGRPLRRMYRITATGRAKAIELRAEFRTEVPT